MKLTSINASANVAVIGASGGIGSAFVELLSSSESVERVFAFSRRATQISSRKVTSLPMDLQDEGSIAQAARQSSSNAPLDLVLVASGLLHSDTIQPEKSWSRLDSQSMRDVLEVNTIGPTLVAKHFLPQLSQENKSVFAVLSARVGSIEDNYLGGWLSYRLSKSAVNMAVRTLSIELARKNPNAIAVSLHPGTVNTPLSQPFQANVPTGKLFSPQQAASKLLGVIDGLTPKDSGGFFAWDASKIPY